MSSLRRGHANLLCIVPILADDLFRGSERMRTLRIFTEGTRNTGQYGGWKKRGEQKIKINVRGRAGIEPATSPTRTENHTSRPTARVPVKVASSEDRTRDLSLTRRMLCQLSYRGESRANATRSRGACTKANKKVCINAVAAAWTSGRLTLH